MGREVARAMLPRGRGTIVFTGATASLRGTRRLLPPSPAPSTRCARWRRAWRANSGPQGIHVAHVVIDGAIDTRLHRRELPRALRDSRARTASSSPDAIAENYWQLHRQPRSAWTHELDLRPWIETW